MGFLNHQSVSSGEYASLMVEEIESLIVKVGKVMPDGADKIKYDIINGWKSYTLEYFQKSPNSFLSENMFFNQLS